MTAVIAFLTGIPSMKSELMQVPDLLSFDSLQVSVSSGCSPSGTTTCTTGRLKCRANAKSRLSCAGTAMMAPVP